MDPHRRFFLLGLVSLPFAASAWAAPDENARKLIKAAREQIGVTLVYDGAYQGLDYPNGDIPRAKGVCTDVIVRAYRDAFEFDLQRAVHEDMRANFSSYPANWGLSRPDRNIDHRRVPNLETWLKRQGGKLDMPRDVRKLDAGDLVTMRLPRNLPHIAIVSDKTRADGTPYIIHNIGWGAREEALTEDLQELLTDRFRLLADLPGL